LYNHEEDFEKRSRNKKLKLVVEYRDFWVVGQESKCKDGCAVDPKNGPKAPNLKTVENLVYLLGWTVGIGKFIY
jgi:hypothetical protein